MKNREKCFPISSAYNTLIAYFKDQGVTLRDIAEVAYEQQKQYHVSYTVDDYEQMIHKALLDIDILSVALTMIQLDYDANKVQMMLPLQHIIDQDMPVYGVDETLALAIAGHYSPIGITQYGALDVNKVGIAQQLDKDEQHTHVFLDDLISALAASVCGLVLKEISRFKP